MGFFDTATEGFKMGVPLGVRSAERAQDEKYRQKMLGFKEEEAGRQRETFERQKKEWNEKDMYKKVHGKSVAARALWQAGDNPGAMKMMLDAYGDYPDGGEARGILKEYNPEAEIWEDPNFKGKEVAFITQKYGPVAFKGMREMFQFMAGVLNEKEFTKASKAAKSAVAKENLRLSRIPITSGGVQWVNTVKMGPGGTMVKGDQVLYEGMKADSPVETKIRQGEEALGRPYTESEKKAVVLGAPKGDKTITVSPGQIVLDKAGKVLFTAPKKGMTETAEAGLKGKKLDNLKKRMSLKAARLSQRWKTVEDADGNITQVKEKPEVTAQRIVDEYGSLSKKEFNKLSKGAKRDFKIAQEMLVIQDEMDAAEGVPVSPGTDKDVTNWRNAIEVTGK